MHVNWNPWVLLFALSSLVASCAQVLLKKSANEPHKSAIREYLNWKVITGYGSMFAGMLLGIIAYAKGVSMQSGAIMEGIGNLWVMLLAFFFFREPLTKRKLLGNALIITGIVVFNLF